MAGSHNRILRAFECIYLMSGLAKVAYAHGTPTWPLGYAENIYEPAFVCYAALKLAPISGAVFKLVTMWIVGKWPSVRGGLIRQWTRFSDWLRNRHR